MKNFFKLLFNIAEPTPVVEPSDEVPDLFAQTERQQAETLSQSAKSRALCKSDFFQELLHKRTTDNMNRVPFEGRRCAVSEADFDLVVAALGSPRVVGYDLYIER